MNIGKSWDSVMREVASRGPPPGPTVEKYVPVAFHMGCIHFYSDLSLNDLRVLLEALVLGPPHWPTDEFYVPIEFHMGSIHFHSALSLNDARLLLEVLNFDSSFRPRFGSFRPIVVLNMGLPQYHYKFLLKML